MIGISFNKTKGFHETIVYSETKGKVDSETRIFKEIYEFHYLKISAKTVFFRYEVAVFMKYNESLTELAVSVQLGDTRKICRFYDTDVSNNGRGFKETMV